jgi:putative tryptophan/tyrosine transport system substrate-binding protein
MMGRRELLMFLGAAASSWPRVLAAQQATMPVIGFLHSGSADQNVERLAAFRKGLSDRGFVDGKDVRIEYRWAEGRNAELPTLAADLVRQRVSLIATPGSTPATVAAKAATSSIPIVFAVGTDPVALGLIASLSRPGGNATGVTSLNAELAAKRLGLFRDLVPSAARYFTLVNPTSELAQPFTRDLESAAASLGIAIEVLRASTDPEIDAAFASLPPQPGSVMVFGPDAFFYTRRAHIAELALRQAVPTIFDVGDYVRAGGLVSYGADFLNVMELAGRYAGRILQGEKPADLPVQQPTKFELLINVKTAKALGLEVPTKLLLIADEVVE